MADATLSKLPADAASISRLSKLEQSLSCQLLALPAEVRNEIYTHLFHNATLGVGTLRICRKLPFCGSVCDCVFPWPVLYTCRQVRREALPMLLAATTLEVSGRYDKTYLLPEQYLSQIKRAIYLDAKLLPHRPIRLAKLSALETLELRNITVWCKYYDESDLLQDNACEMMFNLAMFNLGRVNPALVKVCHDPTRTFKILLGCQYVANSMTHETIEAVIDVDTRKVLRKTKGAAIRERNAWAGFY